MNQSQILPTSQLIIKAKQLIDDTDINSIKKELSNLNETSQQPNFWQKANAQQTMQQIAHLQSQINDFNDLYNLREDLLAHQELYQELSDDSNKQDMVQEEQHIAISLHKLIKKLELNRYLKGNYDSYGAIISIHSGQGGTEAMDWAEMLKRMYVRYFERKNWKHKLISESRGEEAGIKEVSFEINTQYAYGYLKKEQGTHRLVRLSPFNSDNLRQTSFALVEVLPIIDNDTDITIKDEDLSWNFTRAGGAGGQSVNKVNTAVELTHKPSNIVVKCREERSQIQNRERALKTLKSKLASIAEKEQEAELAREKGQHHNASWGTQIRNYVLHPYKLVKDTRTKVETNNTDDVLDGDIDQFIEAEIRLKT